MSETLHKNNLKKLPHISSFLRGTSSQLLLDDHCMTFSDLTSEFSVFFHQLPSYHFHSNTYDKIASGLRILLERKKVHNEKKNKEETNKSLNERLKIHPILLISKRSQYRILIISRLQCLNHSYKIHLFLHFKIMLPISHYIYVFLSNTYYHEELINLK